MTRKTYIVVYEVVNSKGNVIKSGKIKCKNKLSKFDAMAGLDNHLEKTVPDFYKMNVKSCHEDNLLGFDFDMFGKMFGG